MKKKYREREKRMNKKNWYNQLTQRARKQIHSDFANES